MQVNRTHGDLFSKVPKLRIDSSLPPDPSQAAGPPIELDVNEDQDLKSKFVLTGAERQLITDGNVSNRSKYNKRILAKRDRLPERFQSLINDIAILYDGPYLSSEKWEDGLSSGQGKQPNWNNIINWIEDQDESVTVEDIAEKSFETTNTSGYDSPLDSPTELWKEIISVDEQSRLVRDNLFFDGVYGYNREVQFGFEIGSLLQMLRPDGEENPPGSDLIWGFILSFIAGPKESVDEERDAIDALIDELEDRYEDRQQKAAYTPDYSEIMDDVRENDKPTVEAIKELELTPHPILVREVKHHNPVYDEEELGQTAARGVLSKMLDLVPLREIDALQSNLSTDTEAIRSRSVPGVESARQVLSGFVRSEDASLYNSRPTSKITSEVDLTSSEVTQVLNKISEEEVKKEDGGTEYVWVKDNHWTEAPICRKVNPRGSKVIWKLTSYGKLLVYVSFEYSDELDLLYWFALGPEELSLRERHLIIDALSELDYIS